MSYLIRTAGSSNGGLPKMKRAVARHTDGRTMMFFSDQNSASAAGTDTTGVAKFTVYASTDSTRTSWANIIDYTPVQAGASTTIRFVGSMAMNSDNDIFVAYCGTDNSLRMVRWNWNGTSYDAGVSQTVVAANAVTTRYRAIDIDVSNSASGTPAIIVYEALASTGVGAYIRVYIRLDDSTTWRKAYEVQTMTTQTILVNSEDVTISWGADGIVANVGRLAIAYNAFTASSDPGTVVRELSFNTNTGTDLSATTVITWSSNFSVAGNLYSRVAWLFKNKLVGGTACWVFACANGLGFPIFYGIKLHHNSSAFQVNQTSPNPIDAQNRDYGSNYYNTTSGIQACSYSDGKLVFGWPGKGVAGQASSQRALVMLWSETVESDTMTIIDSSNARLLDNNFKQFEVSQAIWGGANQLSVGNYEFSWLFSYGTSSNAISSTPGVTPRYIRTGIEDSLPAPTIIQPSLSTAPKNHPDFQAQSQASQLYHLVRGRLELTIASDSGYTTNVSTVRQDESEYQIYESTNGTSLAIKYINYTLVGAALFTGTWYVKARMIDDLGGASPYTSTTFSVSHPASALPTLPASGTYVTYGAGDVSFNWSFSDTEPNDNQSAYRVLVTVVSTGATAVDTGKITSANRFTSVNLGSAYKDVQLAYQVFLWDLDDNSAGGSDVGFFTISDFPSVLITTPASGGVVSTGLPTFGWTYASPSGKPQAAYRVVVTDLTASPNATVLDTGWVTSSASTYSPSMQILNNTRNYKVLVYVRDNAGLSANAESNIIGNPDMAYNTVSGWTPTTATISSSSTFAHSAPYSMRIVPAGACSVTSTVSYPITTGHSYTGLFWAYSVAGWNSVQVKIDWRNSVDANISFSTGTVVLGAGAWALVSVTGVAPALATQARIVIAMTNTPTGTDILYVDDISLDHDPTLFSSSWTAPVDGDVHVTSDKFKAIITWTNALQDVNFVAWRVYRRYRKAASDALDVNNTRNTWEMIYETSTVSSSYTYMDYFVPLGKSVDYTVVQLVDRFGSAIESPISSYVNITVTGDRYFFVPAVPIGAIASFEAAFVTADSFTREIEQETLHIKNRGRQVQMGDDLGYTGSYTIKLRNPATARSDREFIEMLAASQNGNLYIKSPFGDVLYVAFLSPSFSRLAGVGAYDLGDLTVPYVEVFEDATITRTA